MVELIGALIAKGHAYAAEDGSGDVYFDVRSWPQYGELTHQRIDDMEAAEDADPRGKRDPRDFALWKGWKKETEPETAAWPSPWGPGRPGWHIECSAMAGKYLGQAFDIHGGGVDLRFPHHENEQAQSRAAGHPFASYWMHNAWITTAGEKMSKSLGNSLLIPAVLERFRGIELRYYLVAAHYRSHVEFSFEALEEAAVGFRRIEGFLERAAEAVGEIPAGGIACAEFVEAMDDDLGTPAAVAVIHDVVREGNKLLAAGDSRRAPRHRRLGARHARRARPLPVRRGLGERASGKDDQQLTAGRRRARRRPARAARRGAGGQGLRRRRRDPRPDQGRRHRDRGHPHRPQVVTGSRQRSNGWQLAAQGRDQEDRQGQPHRRLRRPRPPRPRGQGPDAQGEGPPLPQGPQAAPEGRQGRRRRGPSGARRAPPTPSGSPGRNSVVEALREGVPVTGVYVAEGAERDGRLREAFKLAAERGLSLLEVSRTELDRMTGGAVHQGLAARLPSYEYAHPDDLLDRAAELGEPPLIVALDSVTDPRNLGAVVRSAAGFGAHGVVIPERRAAGMTAAAWKTSAGAAARIPVAQTVNLVRQLKAYQDAGCMVVGLAADGDVSPARPRPGRRPARGRGRLRGQGPGPPGRRDLRPAGVDPDGQPARVAQRRRRRLGRPLRDRPGPRLTCRSRGRVPENASRRVLRHTTRAGRITAYVAVWVVLTFLASLALFLVSSRSIVLASHDAVIRPDLGGHVVLHTGPVLPDFRAETGHRIGVDIRLGKTDARSTQELVQRYAYIASQPEGQVAKVKEALTDMAYAALLRGAVVGLLPILVWLLLGPGRRRELFARARSPAGALVVLLVALLVLVSWQPWGRGDDPVVAGRTWMPLAQFVGPEVPLPDEADGIEVLGDVTTTQTRRLIESAVYTYDKSKSFYAQAADAAAGLDLHRRGDGETVVALVSDRHDNIGMDPVARAVADAAGATAVFDAGDDTSSGNSWEAFSLDSVTAAFEDLDRWGVAGNHDHGSFVSNYLADHGWTDARRVRGRAGPAGTTLLGVDDPRSSGLGGLARRDRPQLRRGRQPARRRGLRRRRDGSPRCWSTTPTSAREALDRGCVDLVLAGHLHVQVGPTRVIGRNGEAGYTYTNGTTGGAAYAIAVGSKPRREAEMTPGDLPRRAPGGHPAGAAADRRHLPRAPVRRAAPERGRGTHGPRGPHPARGRGAVAACCGRPGLTGRAQP